MLGNLSNEPAVAKRLHQLDLDKSYQDGSCDSLSFALLESNPDVVAVDVLVNENGEMWHSIARHRDGSYIDSLGRWDEADLFDYWETVAEREDAGELSWRRDAHEQSASPSHGEEHNLKLLVNYLSSL